MTRERPIAGAPTPPRGEPGQNWPRAEPDWTPAPPAPPGRQAPRPGSGAFDPGTYDPWAPPGPPTAPGPPGPPDAYDPFETGDPTQWVPPVAPGPPGPPGAPGPGPAPGTLPPDSDEPNDGFAVAALVFGVLGGLLAVVFGIVALLRIRRSGRPGKRLAVAGLVLAAIWIVGLGAALALRGPDDAERSGDGAIVAAGDLSAFSFREGDCWNDPPLDEVVQTVDAVPCTESHDAEVYAVYDVDFDEFPGDDEIGAAAEAGCIERFPAFAGIDYASSTLEVVYLNPTKESWDTEDDRSAVCSVSDPAAPATGSLRNAAR